MIVCTSAYTCIAIFMIISLSVFEKNLSKEEKNNDLGKQLQSRPIELDLAWPRPMRYIYCRFLGM